jgi:hypothetical protein
MGETWNWSARAARGSRPIASNSRMTNVYLEWSGRGLSRYYPRTCLEGLRNASFKRAGVTNRVLHTLYRHTSLLGFKDCYDTSILQSVLNQCWIMLLGATWGFCPGITDSQSEMGREGSWEIFSVATAMSWGGMRVSVCVHMRAAG